MRDLDPLGFKLESLASNSNDPFMSDGEAALQLGVLQHLKSKLNLFTNGRFRRRMNFEPNDTGSSCRGKAEHVRKIGVQRDQHPIFLDCVLSDPHLRFARKSDFYGCNHIVALSPKNSRLLWRKILVEKKSHEARMISLLARLAAY